MAFSQEETAKLPDHTSLLCISIKYYYFYFFSSSPELKQWSYSPTPSWEPPLAAFFDVHGIFKKRGERNKMVRGIGTMVKSCRDEREKETQWQREGCSQHGDCKVGRRWPRLRAVGLVGAAGAEGCRHTPLRVGFILPITRVANHSALPNDSIWPRDPHAFEHQPVRSRAY